MEVVAVVATGILHPVFKRLGAKGLFLTLASICWIGYIGWRVRQRPAQWKKWGFRTDNLWHVSQWPTVLFVLAIFGMAWYGMMSGRILWQDHVVVLLLLYPLWGVLQQFLVQALGVSHLLTLFPRQGRLLVLPFGVGGFLREYISRIGG